MKKYFILSLMVIGQHLTIGQIIQQTRDQVIAMTPLWKGERLADGRPFVPDRLMERLKNISTEESWQILRNEGYNNQFEGHWDIINPGESMVGRGP